MTRLKSLECQEKRHEDCLFEIDPPPAVLPRAFESGPDHTQPSLL